MFDVMYSIKVMLESSKQFFFVPMKAGTLFTLIQLESYTLFPLADITIVKKIKCDNQRSSVGRL